jgi:hypothetical protein
MATAVDPEVVQDESFDDHSLSLTTTGTAE